MTDQTEMPTESEPEVNRIASLFREGKLEYYSMSEDEKLFLSIDLQKYHTIFKKFWQIVSIQFTTAIPTACIAPVRNADSLASMFINPDLWAASTHTQKLWLICHECLHAILDHFSRGALLKHHELANKMMDVVINHTTIEKFGFKRSEIDPDDVYCWMDKFFKPEDNILSGMNFEYYYDEVIKNPAKYGNGRLLDDHSMMNMSFEDLIKKMNDVLNDTEKQFLKDWLDKNGGINQGEGNGGGSLWTFGKQYVKKKKKWESVIKKWVIKIIGYKEKQINQWVHENRRLALLSKKLCLPSDNDQDELNKKKEKTPVFFFQDASGSCWSYAERFFKAAKSIPPDKFDIYMFSFDDRVYEVDMEKGQIEGGGGTRFDIIETKVQEVLKEKNLSYKNISVWIITDAEGNAVHPEIEENWNWFLTSRYDNKHCIPKKSVVYYLDDYE